jgi:hypothetical protein
MLVLICTAAAPGCNVSRIQMTTVWCTVDMCVCVCVHSAHCTLQIPLVLLLLHPTYPAAYIPAHQFLRVANPEVRAGRWTAAWVRAPLSSFLRGGVGVREEKKIGGIRNLNTVFRDSFTTFMRGCTHQSSSGPAVELISSNLFAYMCEGVELFSLPKLFIILGSLPYTSWQWLCVLAWPAVCLKKRRNLHFFLKCSAKEKSNNSL